MRFLVFTWLALVMLPAQAQDSYALKGTIRSETGEAIPLAHIRNNLASTVANKRGEFALNLPPGKHTLQVSAVGFEEKTIQVSSPNRALQIKLNTSTATLSDVVVTATRTTRKADEIPLPVQVIGEEEIEQMGSIRLQEVLAEQTGLQIISDHGNGLQMQGLNSDYILFLVDGEPLVGRTAGTLELNRIAVDNIKRIEIIKGPSSSLYGSEAMAGVVNIITKDPDSGFEGSLNTQHRSYNTHDIGTTLSYKQDNLSVSLFANRLRSDGYDLTEATVSQTIPAYQALTLAPKVAYRFSDRVKLQVNSRFYLENQQNETDFDLEEGTVRMDNTGRQDDWNLMPTLIINVGDQDRLQLRSYTTGYNTLSRYIRQDNESIHEESTFSQLFNRSEVQYDHYFNDRHITTMGVGYTNESVTATRYENVDPFRAAYAFVQHQWIPGNKFNLVAGGRFDTHNAYASRFSPKLAANYRVNDWVSVQASFGGGYKAPDFRQLILNFTNPVAGYTVLGTNVVQERFSALEASGQIAQVFIDPATLETIQAETSLAWNAGIAITPSAALEVNINGFRNEISNLIDAAPIAQKTNGQNVFSYFNYDEVVTQGIEVDVNYSLTPGLRLAAGYQYLDARNLEDVERIKAGEVFTRNPETNRTSKVALADYGGLPGRSRHSGNARLFYSLPKHGINASARAIYRGRWGLGDNNGNGIVDTSQEYADGYWQVNLSAAKSIFNWLTVEAGVNNVLNTTNAFEPSLPGRIWFGGLQMNFKSN